MVTCKALGKRVADTGQKLPSSPLLQGVIYQDQIQRGKKESRLRGEGGREGLARGEEGKITHQNRKDRIFSEKPDARKMRREPLL